MPLTDQAHRKQSRSGCIYSTFLRCEWSHVSPNCLTNANGMKNQNGFSPTRLDVKSHWLQVFVFSSLCIFICSLRSYLLMFTFFAFFFFVLSKILCISIILALEDEVCPFLVSHKSKRSLWNWERVMLYGLSLFPITDIGHTHLGTIRSLGFLTHSCLGFQPRGWQGDWGGVYFHLVAGPRLFFERSVS